MANHPKLFPTLRNPILLIRLPGQKFVRYGIFFAALGAVSLLPASLVYAGDAIVAVNQNGRKIYVNKDDAAPEGKHAEAAPVQKRLVYWSSTERRWKRVPSPSPVAMRNARSAAEEVSQVIETSPQAAGNAPVKNFAPDTRALAAGHQITQQSVDEAIVAAAARHNVDVNLVRAIIKVESNFNPRAVSRKGAIGLMQLMPQTARELNVTNPFDVNQNVDGGVRHFKGLLNNFGGDVRLSLAAYNAGTGAVMSSGGVPPYSETRNYVKKITDLYGTSRPYRMLGTAEDSPIRASRDSRGHLVFTND